jgi:glucosamine 6-phosphate synthetase-like amidotransferase/phosphosugar isomerase protein
MTVSNSSNPMRDQVYSLPDLIREQIWTLEARTREVLTTPEIFATRHIVLTGCGDSHISAMAAELAFTELAGIHTQALSAMQASRYSAHHSKRQYPSNPLLVAVSNSGEVARVVEAVKNYRIHGAVTIGISSNPESRLAAHADRVVEVNIPPFAPAPGVRSYFISLVTLYLLAIRLGEVRGVHTADEATALRRELERTADAMRTTVEALEEPLRKLADDWSSLANFEFLGSGSDRGTAAYGAAKCLEAVGVHALHQDIEEWVHLEYFVAEAVRTGTIVICPTNSAASSRVSEIEVFLEHLERPYVILTGKSDSGQFKRLLSLETDVRPLFAPLLYSVPLALFAAFLSQRVNASYGRGAAGPWADCRDGMTTRHSTIL